MASSVSSDTAPQSNEGSFLVATEEANLALDVEGVGFTDDFHCLSR